MKIKTTESNLYLFLGITMLTQAVTSLVGGIMFKILGSEEAIETTMYNIAQHVLAVNLSIVLQIITAIVIIMLGVAIYQIAGHVNKTMAILGLIFYSLEATLVAVSQLFTFGLLKVSLQSMAQADPSLIQLGYALFACKDFSAKIAMVPFGLGALLLYYLLMKAKVIPKWLALWGLFTAPLILIAIPLMAFGVKVPLYFLAPYVPFEFFAGLFILSSYMKTRFQ